MEVLRADLEKVPVLIEIRNGSAVSDLGLLGIHLYLCYINNLNESRV